MPRDIRTYQSFVKWFAQRVRESQSHESLLQARRRTPFRRTGPAPQWHPDSYTQPGEVE